MSDIELGRKALRHFHDYSKMLWSNSYAPSSVDALINLWPEKKRDIYLDGIGLAIRINNISDSDVRIAMENLAKQSKGQIPADHQAYTKFLGGQVGSIKFLDLTTTVVKETATQLVQGAQAIGDQVIASGKLLTFLLPVAALFFAYSWYQNFLPKKSKKK